MRFVWAVVAFFLAALCIGAGIAQRTVFLGDKSEQAAISVEGDLRYTLIDGAVLSQSPGAQTLMVRGDAEVFAAYGRTADMQAWLSDAEYNHVTVEKGEIVTSQVAPEVDDAADDENAGAVTPSATPTPEGDAATPAPGRNPAGSDLWLDQFSADRALIAPLKLPETMSVLIASDGTQPAPTDISVSWPVDNSTPWVGPLLVLGALLLVAGVLLWLLGIRHVRRSRGPRRKGLPPLPETEPIDLSVVEESKGVISAAPTRKAVGTGRRSLIAIPAVAVSALLFTGCTADAWPQLGGTASPTPSASASVIVPEGQLPPAVTETQASRILSAVSETVAAADEAKDAALAETRLTGAALAERKTNYTLRDKIKDHKALTAIPAKPVAALLPQQTDGWPRSVMTIVYDDDDDTVAPTIMMMTQADPWSNYKVAYLGNLEASAELPEVAPVDIGAIQVQPDSAFLIMEPGQLANAYADTLNKGDKSEYAGLFDANADSFRTSVATDRSTRLEAFNKTGKKTGSLTFQSTAADTDPLALATLESGAIVAVNIYETDTVKPTNDDAVIKLTDSPTVRALTGVKQSASGFTTTFSDQLFFYVPGRGSTEKIRLLGYGSNVLNAQVIKSAKEKKK